MRGGAESSKHLIIASSFWLAASILELFRSLWRVTLLEQKPLSPCHPGNSKGFRRSVSGDGIMAKSCRTLLRPHGLQPTPWTVSCPWNSPGKNTGVVCHFLLQGNFPTQRSNLGLPALQVDSLLTKPPGKPRVKNQILEQNMLQLTPGDWDNQWSITPAGWSLHMLFSH